MTKPEIVKIERANPALSRGAVALRKHRQRLGESQSEFARRFGLSRMQLARMETGHHGPDIGVAVWFQNDGICTVEDWTVPAQVCAHG